MKVKNSREMNLNIYFLHPYTVWKVSKYGVFSGLYFSILGLNTEIYGEK